jgi:hypothetical protein
MNDMWSPEMGEAAFDPSTVLLRLMLLLHHVLLLLHLLLLHLLLLYLLLMLLLLLFSLAGAVAIEARQAWTNSAPHTTAPSNCCARVALAGQPSALRGRGQATGRVARRAEGGDRRGANLNKTHCRKIRCRKRGTRATWLCTK